MTYAQGIGRHSQSEVEQLLEDDLSALSDFLGKPPVNSALWMPRQKVYGNNGLPLV